MPSTPPSAHAARGVVIGMQADTFVTSTAFDRINARLEQRARQFKRPVLLLQGDTHVYKTDRPFAGAPNLVRVVVEGETAERVAAPDRRPAHARRVPLEARCRSPPQLTVASFNIHHGAGTDDRLDLERVAAEIKRTGAAVVGLQEVDRFWSERSAFVDQAQWLADRLGMHVVYGANLDLDPPALDRPRRQYGTAILSVAPDRLQPQHAASAAAERRATRAARGRDRRRRHPRARRQHPPAAQQRGRAARPDRADRRTARSGQHPGDPARATSTPLRARPSSRRWRRASPTRGRAAGPATASAIPPPRRTPASTTCSPPTDVDVALRAHAGLSGLRSPPGDRGPRAAGRPRTTSPGVRHPGPPRRPRAHRGEHARVVRARRSSSGVSTLELDVQITQDGHAVVTHDRRSPAASATTPRRPRRRPRVPVRRQVHQHLSLTQVQHARLRSQPQPQLPGQQRRPGRPDAAAARGLRAGPPLPRARREAEHRDQGRGRRAERDRAARAVRPGRRAGDPHRPARSTR